MTTKRISQKRQMDIRKSISVDLQIVFRNSKEEFWTQRRLNENVTRAMYEKADERFHLLSATHREFVYGYLEALRNQLWNELKPMYRVDGKWYRPQQIGRDGGPAFETCSSENCHYCYVETTEDGIQYHQFT